MTMQDATELFIKMNTKAPEGFHYELRESENSGSVSPYYVARVKS